MSNSNSSTVSLSSGNTYDSFGEIISHINSLAEYLERLGETGTERSTGFAWTLSDDASTGRFDTRSQVTVVFSDEQSQVTVTPGTSASSGSMAGRGKSPTLPLEKPNYGTLMADSEGIETRKQVLERRRKDCAAEEVDVALAPVLKINVPFVFYPEQYKAFRKMFPRVNVDSGLHYTHHDHPVAHTATMVGLRKMQNMLQPGELVLDLHGNPNGNEAFNNFQNARRRKRPNLPYPPVIETMVEERTAADAVRRVTKWGPQYDEFGVKRWNRHCMDDIQNGLYDTFLSCHTLYYYTMGEINQLLHKNPSSKIYALVNYTKEQAGTLYGELKYSKSNGITTQVSPNGEKYTHPDIDCWFQTNSYRGVTQNTDSGISWTSMSLGGPLYVIVITACAYELATRHGYVPPAAPTLQIEKGKTTLFGLLRVNGQDVRLRITNSELAQELRHFMTMRDRSDPQVFADLCVKARRLTSRDLVEGSRQHQVNDGELQDHIVYAYLVDAPGEKELMDGVMVLKADLLVPLGASLKLNGELKEASWLWSNPLIVKIFGRNNYKPALGSRNNNKAVYHQTDKNTGGLISFGRT